MRERVELEKENWRVAAGQHGRVENQNGDKNKRLRRVSATLDRKREMERFGIRETTIVSAMIRVNTRISAIHKLTKSEIEIERL